MLFDHERFKDITSGFQSIAVCIAVLVGGCWALYTLTTTRAAETAQAKYEKALQDLREQRVINISIKPEVVTDPGTTDKYIYILVELTNTGTHVEEVAPIGSPLTVRKVWMDAGKQVMVDRPSGVVLPIQIDGQGSWRMLPGEVVRFPCLTKVSGPGIYYIRFQVTASKAEQRFAYVEAEYPAKAKPVHWASSTCLIVE